MPSPHVSSRSRWGPAFFPQRARARMFKLICICILILAGHIVRALLNISWLISAAGDWMHRATSEPVPLALLTYMHEAGVPTDLATGVGALAMAVGANGQEPLSDPWTLLRFLLANAHNVRAAAVNYKETIRWRNSFPLREVMAAYGCAKEYRTNGTRATDAIQWGCWWSPSSSEARLVAKHTFFRRLSSATAEDGGPILVWRVGAADFSGFVREGLVDALLRAFVAHLEDALQSTRAASLQGKRYVSARLIIDAEGFWIGHVQYFPLLRRILHICESHFPELSASVTIVRAPWSALQAFSVVRPLLREQLRTQISILGEDFQEELLAHSGLHLSMLPRFLGGNVSDNEVGLAKPVPLGVRLFV